METTRAYNSPMLKLAVFAAFLAAQCLITWYGYFLGKVPTRGVAFGWRYDSPMISLLLTLIAFIWIPIVINFLYGVGFQWGNVAFRSFLVIITLWIAAAPIAALLFNVMVTKEKVDEIIVLGMVLVTVGSVLVAAHKEILQVLR